MKIPTWAYMFIIGVELMTIGIIECYLFYPQDMTFIVPAITGTFMILFADEIAYAIDEG